MPFSAGLRHTLLRQRDDRIDGRAAPVIDRHILSNAKSRVAHAGWGVSYLDVFDPCVGRAAAESLLEARDGVRVPVGVNLYPPVWRVANPAADSFLLRGGLGEVAKSHPLDTAADHIAPADTHLVDVLVG
jgi:hypothetical protein